MEHDVDLENDHSIDQTAGVSVDTTTASRDRNAEFAARQEQIDRNVELAKSGIGLCAAVDVEPAKAAMSQLADVLKSAMNGTKELHTLSDNIRSALQEIAAQYITENHDAVERMAGELIGRQNQLLTRLDTRIDAAATNAQLRLETEILRGDTLRSLEETVAWQSVAMQQVVLQAAEELNELHLQMQKLGVDAKQAATRGLEYSWSDNVHLKRAEAGGVTVAVKPGEDGRVTIKLPDHTLVDLRFETTPTGHVKDWIATSSGNNVAVVRREGATNHSNLFAATVVHDGGTIKIIEHQSSETKKSLEAHVEAPVKVVTVGVGGEAAWGNSTGKDFERTQNQHTSTSFAVKVVFEPKPRPAVKILRGPN